VLFLPRENPEACCFTPFFLAVSRFLPTSALRRTTSFLTHPPFPYCSAHYSQCLLRKTTKYGPAFFFTFFYSGSRICAKICRTKMGGTQKTIVYKVLFTVFGVSEFVAVGNTTLSVLTSALFSGTLK
jgi:hypothetical protein